MIPRLALLPLALVACASPPPRHHVLEAEAPDRRVSDHDSFARTIDSRWASGRSCLVGFYLDGECTWSFELPRRGVRTIWLRYSATTDTTIRVRIDDGPEIEHRVRATGALKGKYAWGWTRLHREDFAAGRHEVTLGNAPIRPDCLVVARGTGRPDYLVPSPIGPSPEEGWKLLDRPLARARPDWLDEAVGYELPPWFEGSRVSLHTRLTARWRDEAVFETAAESFRALGVRTFVRHLRTLGEGAWWPSAVGPVEPWARDEDVAAGIIDRAHAAGCRIVGYYRHMEDVGMAELHPEWIALDDLGRPVLRNGRPKLCFNSPYADFVLERLLELVDKGVDGLYFDEVHMPRGGCWCSFCRDAFHEATGLRHPKALDPEDPVWQKLVEFNNLTIERTFLRYRRVLHERNPEVVLVISNNIAPDLFGSHTTGRLLRIADSVKTEFAKGDSSRSQSFFREHPEFVPPERDARIALGYAFCRDGADGRPPHVWVHNLQDEDSAVFATAGILTHGGIANLDHPEADIPDAGKFAKAIALGERVAPHLAGTRPLRWAAIHVPEIARDRAGHGTVDRWTKVLSPLYGMWFTLLRSRLPVGLVTDSQLAEGALDGYSLLFLPAGDELTDDMASAVERFQADGGRVVKQREEWLWHDPVDGGAAVSGFVTEIAGDATLAPVQVLGGRPKMHAVPFLAPDGERLVVSIANDFSWVWAARREVPGGEPVLLPEGADVVPPPCERVRVVVRSPYVPRSAVEIVTGTALEISPVEEGFEIAVPDFEALAVVVLEL